MHPPIHSVRAARLLSVAAALLILTVSAGGQTTFYVAPCGDDAWSGTSPVCAMPDGPKATILAALSVAADGDEIVLADGTYAGPLNRGLTIDGAEKEITLRSENGPDACIIDCGGVANFLTLMNTFETVVEGLTIRNGSALIGGAVRCSDGSPILRNCVFGGLEPGQGNTATIGGGLYCSDSTVTLEGCRFELCTATDPGGGIHANESTLLISGCRFERNQSLTGGAIYSVYSPLTTVVDSIFLDNTALGGVTGWDGGGAIKVEASVLEVVGCDFTGNASLDASGGAVYYHMASSGAVTDSTFQENVTGNLYCGGGIFLTSQSNAEVSGCSFVGNVASGTGGGFCEVSGGTTVVRDCEFQGNSARSGGAFSSLRSPLVVDCSFESNVAAGADRSTGGAMVVWGQGAPQVLNCTFRENQAPVGGAVSVLDPDTNPVFANCLFTGNVAADDPDDLFGSGGSVMLVRQGPGTFVGCTFAGNVSDDSGGVGRVACGGVLTLDGCIAWGNESPDDSTFHLYLNAECDLDSPMLEIMHSCVEGGLEGIVIDDRDAVMLWHKSNIDDDPLFVQPRAGNYRLAAGSPCIDAGDNAALPADLADLDGDGDVGEPISLDLDWLPRFVDDPATRDSGVPTPLDCPADVDESGSVDVMDLALLINAWGELDHPFDVNGDGIIDVADLVEVILAWGACPSSPVSDMGAYEFQG